MESVNHRGLTGRQVTVAIGLKTKVIQSMNDKELREAALASLKHRRGLERQLRIYAITNITLVVIWALSGRGDFWPIWSISFWGLALIWQAISYNHRPKPITEDEIKSEMKKLGS